ncbi:hypothetical protein SK128_010021 [Halocaridina rubra]|uniref:ShKT domain-containing protein n=1 Tax=Halocaridina rubra TaxID=373956 RepID=A0AAN9AHC3_HALRR
MDSARLAKGDYLSASITGNPLHLYAVIKRLVLFWPAINRVLYIISDVNYSCQDRHLSCSWWSKWGECGKNPSYMMINCQLSCGLCGKPEVHGKMAALRKLENHTVLPSSNDLRGAAIALARLQQIYRLPIPDMAEGRVANVSTCVRLSAYDCIRIANESHNEADYANAWQWYNYALGSTTSPELKEHIRGLMYFVKIQHDEYHQLFNPRYFEKRLSELELQIPQDTVYAQLCRGLHFMVSQSLVTLNTKISFKIKQLASSFDIYIFE